jgi:hypothetical protein
MKLGACEQCGRPAWGTHCRRCIRENLDPTAKPRWLREPETPALLRPPSQRVEKDPETLPLELDDRRVGP